ncbi:S-formylglutathione hydrolase [Rosenbergiella australiborealis]|uniref:S-formylglutathione hydrolase n=1 Tax=Rosenbergiella australiborealis TaxID=1544696 RepID=A0ABS5TA02_9GAMM|nr:S-formylglutathione hydrolase [Rosenbergiella australiborealis]MBT0728282.1 S-formylglutathione hydrolase [Rosenbergiella australiborealis]
MSTSDLSRREKHYAFGGWQEVWQHTSHTLNCMMNFSVYLPPQAATGPVPVLYWLSGLTCNEQNLITKAGFQRYAAELGVMVVAMDTSPRGSDVADDSAWDLGQGAGFYINATEQPWASHFRMYEYVVDELPNIIAAHFPTNGRQAIAGHSMGGHGALMIALKNPGRFSSVSAFAPIVAPSRVAWGQKAFNAYLGHDTRHWQQWDSLCLVEQGQPLPPALIDQGLDDPFYPEQLTTELLETACQARGMIAHFRYHEHYDHSYYFISSFIEEHMRFHATALQL